MPTFTSDMENDKEVRGIKKGLATDNTSQEKADSTLLNNDTGDQADEQGIY